MEGGLGGIDPLHPTLLRREYPDQGIAFSIAPRSGAEISSLRVLWKDQWIETLYRADLQHEECEGWQGRAPWLWPAVGRTFTEDLIDKARRTGDDLKEGAYVIGSKRFPMPIHGFAMSRAWDLESDDDHSIVCSSAPNEKTHQQYSFDFELKISFRTENGSLVTDFEVHAASQNTGSMPFTIGNHVSLDLPLGPDTDFTKCEAFSPASHEMVLTPESLLEGSSRPIDLSRGRTLDDPGLRNAVLGGFSEEECWTAVWCPEGFGMEVRQSVAEGRSFAPGADHWYFVLYGEPEKGFFCPEPWIGGPNALNTGKGLIQLPPGETFTWRLSFTPTRNWPDR